MLSGNKDEVKSLPKSLLIPGPGSERTGMPLIGQDVSVATIARFRKDGDAAYKGQPVSGVIQRIVDREKR